MNERIRELAEQAKLKTELWNNPEPFVIYKEDVNYPGGLEKFAELIVMKCLTICEELGDKGMDGHYCADEINKTFRN
jgi:hypothetical protein